MIPATVAIERSGLPLSTDAYGDIAFEVMRGALARVVSPHAAAITLGTRVFVTETVFEGLVMGDRPDIVAHELVHVDQWRTDGWRFFVRYLGAYARVRVLGVPHLAAYRAIPYEAEAFAVAEAFVDELT